MKNWIGKHGGTIGWVCFIIAYTITLFFLGMVFEWEHYGRVQEVEIQTKIVEYRLGNITLGRDTIDVIQAAKYKQYANNKELE